MKPCRLQACAASHEVKQRGGKPIDGGDVQQLAPAGQEQVAVPQLALQ
jgi:hypothetical protein